MAKSHKTKKHLKSEKAKTKLRTAETKTKFLPKGANVTNVNFKVRPIVIREQLKEHSEDEVLSKRKLNIKDLLSRLKHHNANVKSEAIQDLCEIFSVISDQSVSTIIMSYISQVLQNACNLILDQEKTVRQKAIHLITLILSTIDKERIVPFSNVILAHLKCAMTDIDKNVQADSLLLMDSLINNFPQLLSDNYNKILPVFFILISTVHNNANREKILALNLQSGTTTIKWRIQVLSRLQKILNVINFDKDHLSKDPNSISSLKEVFSVDKSVNHPIYNNLWNGYPFCSSFYNLNTSDEENGENNILDCMNSLIPLLYDTWLEAVPDNSIPQRSDEGTVLNQDTASILKSILNIFYFLWQLTKSNENNAIQYVENLFQTKSAKKFLNHILLQFPYSQKQASLKEKEKAFKDMLQLNTDPKCVEINLLVCYLFFKVNRKIINDQQRKDSEKIFHYLKNCLCNTNFIKEDNYKHLISVIQIIYENLIHWNQNQSTVSEIIDNLIHFYENNVFTEGNRAILLDMLCTIAQNVNLAVSQRLEQWIRNLPSSLCKGEVSVSVINTLSFLMRQNNKILQESILNYLPDILENLPNLKLDYMNDGIDKMKLMSLFFYVSHYNEEQMKLLLNFIEKNKNTCLADTMENMLDLRQQLL